MIPAWLSGYLTHTEVQKIALEVKSAEKQTSGEIVPMIVRCSSTLGHVPLLVYTLGLLTYYVIDLPGFADNWLENTWLSIFVWAILWVPVTMMLSKTSFVQRLFVSRVDRELQSQQRAMNEFYQAGLNKTDGSTGILIFVSLVDHQVVVLGDKSIADKLPAETWSEVMELIMQGVRSKNMCDGFCKAIEMCGEILTPHFPIQPDDKNELPNNLIIKE